jgi:Ni,Fe-hydrogenase III large subunit/Ni,Fe-hydrogenase III component G
MLIDEFDLDFTAMPGAVPAWRAELNATQWRAVCRQVRDQGGRLLALWGSERPDSAGFAVHAALAMRAGLAHLSLPVEAGEPYPGITDLFPAADRMQRAVADLLGLRASDQPQARPWMRHGAWPADRFPLRKAFDAATAWTAQADDYAFVSVEGEGVHEIAVGPVHAGTIEPGHFRFSVIGERVLRLEERLGYTHKGIEKRFEGLSLAQGARLAGRISGDSTVAYAWAYAMAVESAAALQPPQRGCWLRALLLEHERIANHLGDLGALGNDAGFAFGLAQFSRLKEDLLRTQAAVFGHRYLMDLIVPGGVICDPELPAVRALQSAYDALEPALARLHDIYEDHAGLQDRFMGAGRVAPELADRLGLCGPAGRASGQSWDTRVQYPTWPYDALDVRMAIQRNGDVAARVQLRFDEVAESIRLCREILLRMPGGIVRTALPIVSDGALGMGWVEGWRGEVLVALEVGAEQAIHRLHPHDPSWHNWPVLEHAVIGNIVPDFPLINKSFNLSYSGHDL